MRLARPTLVCLALAVSIVAGCGSGTDLMPTPTIQFAEETDLVSRTPEGLRTDQADILYVTDRGVEITEDGTIHYGFRRSTSVAFGSVVVGFGDSPGWEALAEASQSEKRKGSFELRVVSIEERGRFPGTPTVDEDSARRDEMAVALRSEIADRLAGTTRKEAYVFVHGYNNTFEDGVFVQAEYWHFLGREGVPIAYSWPAGSSGLLRGYNRDRESGEFTVYHLKQFLRLLGTCPGLEKVHLIAHSRGTDVVTSAVRELTIEARASNRRLEETYRIANLILIAPDLDADVFRQRVVAEDIHDSVGWLTVYVSGGDKVLGLAGWLYESEERVGAITADELTPGQRESLAESKRVSLIEVMDRTGSGGHSYYQASPSVSSDLILLLRGHRPGAENGRPLESVSHGLWRLPEDYLRSGDQETK